MVIVRLPLQGLDAAGARAQVAHALAGTPGDAVVQLRPAGPVPAAAEPALSAASLRALAGGRTVTVARPDRAFARPLDLTAPPL
jgi:hypothetical protein